MRTFLFIIFSLFQIINVYAQIFHEDFEYADSVFHSSTGVGMWAPNDRLSTNGYYCDSVSTLAPGDLAKMTTIPFSTVGYNSLFLYFDHICKIEFFDDAIIEVSSDNGLSWINICNNSYMGYSNYTSQNCRFQEASYATWQPGNSSLPDST